MSFARLWSCRFYTPQHWKKFFVAYFYFQGWDAWSLGFHICPTLPNLEIHLPFGFVRIGWIEAIDVEAIGKRFGICWYPRGDYK